MKCPYCGSLENKVVDKRETSGDEITRRRRECLSCEKRFTTYERVELVNITVIKKSGTKQTFDKNKLELGILRACEKRPITREKVKNICDEIEISLRNKDSIEIPTRQIGSLVMRKLKKLDHVAYVRFASVYKEFQDVDSFKSELKKLGG